MKSHEFTNKKRIKSKCFIFRIMNLIGVNPIGISVIPIGIAFFHIFKAKIFCGIVFE